MKEYKCVKELQVECYDDDGHFTEETTTIEVGSVWIDEEDDFRMIDGEIHLIKKIDEKMCNWLEICNETLSECFEYIKHQDHIIVVGK